MLPAEQGLGPQASPGGCGRARPGGLPQARPHSWPPPACPRQPKGRTPEEQHPCRPPALTLGNAGREDPRPPTGAAGWAPVCFLFCGPGCCWLQEERDARWCSGHSPSSPAMAGTAWDSKCELSRPRRQACGVGGGRPLRGWLAVGVAGMGCPPSVGGCSCLSGPGVPLVLAWPGPPS